MSTRTNCLITIFRPPLDATALGQAVLRHFRALPGAHAAWTAASVDFQPTTAVDQNILLQAGDKWQKHAARVAQWISTQSPTEAASVGAIINVAGSWDGAAVAAPEFYASVERMYKANVEPALVAAHVAARALAPGGLLLNTGAASVTLLQPTAGMLAYGVAKAAVSQIHRSMAAPGALPSGARSILIAPYVRVYVC